MLLHKNHTYHALLLLFACFLGSSAWAQASFDPRIPDGIVKPKSYRISLQGKGNTFTVPEGRNLYITRLTVSPSSVMSDTGFLTIDGMPVMSFNKGLDLCGIGLD
ncbi:hypothetical protein [Eisenibacter elegans]|uniref:hypothetical protein n=1 Tax=Eisenibacter elegans TaxID=997 RepID=UPI00040FC292|nr:hypothetical protein [Eisenibacter elegans]